LFLLFLRHLCTSKASTFVTAHASSHLSRRKGHTQPFSVKDVLVP
jgi:hypothetical protein